MSEQKIYDFTNPNDYQFDSDLIDFTALQKPRLKLTSCAGGCTFTEDFADDTDFIYDNTKAEFTGGKVQQIDTRPENATLYAGFPTNENSSWGGNLSNILSGGATWSNGRIDLTGNSGKILSMPGDSGNFNTVGTAGCIRFKYIPNYSALVGIRQILEFKNPTTNNNLIQIYQNGNSIICDLRDSSGTQHLLIAAIQTLSAGTAYIFELDFDFDGTSRFFLNGISKGSLNTSAWTRTAESGIFKWAGPSGSGDFYLDDVILFSSVQHTANHANDLPYSYNNTIYLESNVVLPEMQYEGPGTLITFDLFTTLEGGSPRYTLQIGRSGNYLYWDGIAWSISDGTYNQANSVTTFNANLGDLDIEGEIYGQFKVHFMNSNTQSYVDNLTATLTNQVYYTSNPSIIFNDLLSMELFSNFVEVSTKTGSDEIKYILSKNSIQYYWNGSSWAISDGTYSQSNTAAEILANKSTFTTEGITFAIEMFLHSADGKTTPIATSVTVTYDFYGGDDIAITKCNVFGYCVDENDDPISGVSISIELEKDIAVYDSQKVIFQSPITTTSDSNGYWDVELIPTADLNNVNYRFTFNYGGESRLYRRKVPAVARKNFSELTL